MNRCSTTIASIPVTCNVDGLYLFSSIANAVAGTVSYKYDATSNAIIANTDTINVSGVFGYAIKAANKSVIFADYNGGAWGKDTAQTIATFDFAD